MTSVILGLGNPGPHYKHSRHNTGLLCMEKLSKKFGITIQDKRRYVTTGEGLLLEESIILAKSRIFMNESGIAGRYLINRYGITPDKLLVIHDDMDLPLGQFRLKLGGGTAGHNGILSLVNTIGTDVFPRLRLGIGHPETSDPISFVLGNFTTNESMIMESTLTSASEAIQWLINYGIDSAMNKYNTRNTSSHREEDEK